VARLESWAERWLRAWRKPAQRWLWSGRNAHGQTRVISIQGNGGQAAFFGADAMRRENLHEAHEAIVRASALDGARERRGR